MEKIQETVIKELAALFPFRSKDLLRLETKIADLPLDSLTYVKFIANLEEALQITFDISVLTLDYFSTVQSVVEYITSLVALTGKFK